MSWVASSEMLVMLAVLALLVMELVSLRRTQRRDRDKAEALRREPPPER